MNYVIKNISSNAPEQEIVINGDDFFRSLIGHHGKSHFHADIKSAVYRGHPGGIWSMISEQEKRDSSLNTWFWLYRYYNRIVQARYAKHYWNKYLKAVFRCASIVELTKAYVIRLFKLTEIKSAIWHWAHKVVSR